MKKPLLLSAFLALLSIMLAYLPPFWPPLPGWRNYSPSSGPSFGQAFAHPAAHMSTPFTPPEVSAILGPHWDSHHFSYHFHKYSPFMVMFTRPCCETFARKEHARYQMKTRATVDGVNSTPPTVDKANRIENECTTGGGSKAMRSTEQSGEKVVMPFLLSSTAKTNDPQWQTNTMLVNTNNNFSSDKPLELG